jgi:hypothetical protein
MNTLRLFGVATAVTLVLALAPTASFARRGGGFGGGHVAAAGRMGGNFGAGRMGGGFGSARVAGFRTGGVGNFRAARASFAAVPGATFGARGWTRPGWRGGRWIGARTAWAGRPWIGARTAWAGGWRGARWRRGWGWGAAPFAVGFGLGLGSPWYDSYAYAGPTYAAYGGPCTCSTSTWW